MPHDPIYFHPGTPADDPTVGTGEPHWDDPQTDTPLPADDPTTDYPTTFPSGEGSLRSFSEADIFGLPQGGLSMPEGAGGIDTLTGQYTPAPGYVLDEGLPLDAQGNPTHQTFSPVPEVPEEVRAVPFWGLDRPARIEFAAGDERFQSAPSLNDYLVDIGLSRPEADRIAGDYENDPAMMEWLRSTMISDFQDDQEINYGIGSLPSGVLSELQGIISADPAAPTEDPGHVDTWMYDQGYIDSVSSEIDVLMDTTEWTADSIDQLADLRNEIDLAQENMGSMRPDSPYADFDFSDPGGVMTGSDPWIPEGGEYDPYDIAGRGPFAPGYVLGSMFGADQAADMLSRDPWGQDWKLPAPISVDIPEMTDEEKGAFFAADRFFSTLMSTVSERNLINPYTGEPDLNAFWQQMEAESPDVYAQLRDMYNYHGANWEQHADTYYKNAQRAMMEFYQSPEYGPAAAERIRAILPIAASIAPALGIPPEVLEQQLRAAAEAAESGEDYDVSWVFDVARNLDSSLGGGSSLGGDAGTGGDTGGGDTGGDTSGEQTPPVKTPPGTEGLLSVGSGASNMDVFGGQRESGFSAEQVNAIGDIVTRNAIERGVSDAGNLDTIDVPQFVINARQNEGYMHPITQWMNMTESQRNKAIGDAAAEGWDVSEVSMVNPNADIYSVDDSGSQFYIPEWLAEKISVGELVNGETPSYDWWQSIGAEERSRLQDEHEADGDSTTLMAVRRIADGVTEEATLSYGPDGEVDIEWLDNPGYSASGVEYGMPQATLADAIRYTIGQDPENYDPMSVSFFENNIGGGLAAIASGMDEGVGLRWNRSGYWEQDSGNHDRFRILNGKVQKKRVGTGGPEQAWKDFSAVSSIARPHSKAMLESLPDAIIGELGLDINSPAFTEDEFDIFRDHFADYLDENGLNFNTLVPPNSSDADLEIAAGQMITGFEYKKTGERERTYRGRPTGVFDDVYSLIPTLGGESWDVDDLSGNRIDVAQTVGDFGNIVEFNPETFFNKFMGFEYEMTDRSKIGFWQLMDSVTPMYDQYQKWWDNTYTAEMSIPSFGTFSSDSTQTAIYAGQKPLEDDYLDPGSYWNAAEEWNQKVRDGYKQVMAIAANNFEVDPMLTWLSNNLDFGYAKGGLVSLAQGGPVPDSGIGGLSAAPPVQAGIDSLLPGQAPSMPIENADLYQIVQNDPILMQATMAILGQHPDPQSAIQQAISAYGEEVIQSLIQAISQQGALQGPGDGLSDSIPATIDGQQPAKLSSGEFVVPADVVSHLGNGDNQSGAGALQQMMSRARGQRTGSPESPPAIDPEIVMPI